jgi:hypothetical protein
LKSQALALAIGLCNPSGMKNQNKRDLEKHWAKEAAKKTAKKQPSPKAKREDVNQTAARIVRQATEL